MGPFFLKSTEISLPCESRLVKLIFAGNAEDHRISLTMSIITRTRQTTVAVVAMTVSTWVILLREVAGLETSPMDFELPRSVLFSLVSSFGPPPTVVRELIYSRTTS